MLSVLRYHEMATRYFQKELPVWNFFANHTHKEDQLKQFKTDLLKNTYKFDPVSDAAMYQKVQLCKEKLGLSLNVILYQAQNSEEMNATIVYLNSEAHIVFSGRLIQLMSDEELTAVLGHELTHVLLYTQLEGSVEVTDRIITAIASNQGSSPAYYETARLFKLYTEIFCDRGAYLVTENYQPIISSLVKISTGLQTVNADSFIKQAEEIFNTDSATKSSGVSHPENFIRARAIWLWHTKGSSAEQEITRMIEGYANLDELDLFGQQKMSAITESLVKILLQPEWIRTPHTLALGNNYFGGLQLEDMPDKVQLSSTIENVHDNIHDYIAYVLYDFATTDKSLEDLPLGYCFSLADELNLEKAFKNAVKKEKKLSDKKVAALKKQSLESYYKESQPV